MNRFFIEIYLKFPFGLAELQFLVIFMQPFVPHRIVEKKYLKLFGNHSDFFYFCKNYNKDILLHKQIYNLLINSILPPPKKKRYRLDLLAVVMG